MQDNLMNRYPSIEIYLSEKGEFCIDKVDAPNSGRRFTVVSISMQELWKMEQEEVIRRTGWTVLKMLNAFNKQAIRDFKSLEGMDSFNAEDEKYNLALSLVHHAITGKTSVHNDSIDLLLKQASENNENAGKFLTDSWPTIRERLKSLDKHDGLG
jgi:hypothetical protein